MSKSVFVVFFCFFFLLSQVKAAFTRTYNKEVHLTPYSLQVVKKGRRGGGGTGGGESELAGEDGENVVQESEEEEEEGLQKDAMIKVGPPARANQPELCVRTLFCASTLCVSHLNSRRRAKPPRSPRRRWRRWRRTRARGRARGRARAKAKAQAEGPARGPAGPNSDPLDQRRLPPCRPHTDCHNSSALSTLRFSFVFLLWWNSSVSPSAQQRLVFLTSSSSPSESKAASVACYHAHVHQCWHLPRSTFASVIRTSACRCYWRTTAKTKDCYCFATGTHQCCLWPKILGPNFVQKKISRTPASVVFFFVSTSGMSVAGTDKPQRPGLLIADIDDCIYCTYLFFQLRKIQLTTFISF